MLIRQSEDNLEGVNPLTIRGNFEVMEFTESNRENGNNEDQNEEMNWARMYFRGKHVQGPRTENRTHTETHTDTHTDIHRHMHTRTDTEGGNGFYSFDINHLVSENWYLCGWVILKEWEEG